MRCMPAKDQLHLVFGESLKFWRLKKGLSQEELAQEAGTSTSFMGMLERGERSTTLEKISKIADALSIEVRDLFTSEEVPHTYREAELLLRRILSTADESQVQLFVAFCEIFNTHVERKKT